MFQTRFPHRPLETLSALKQIRQLTSATMAGLLMLSMSSPAWAAVAKRVTLMGLEAKTAENQIVMYLSDPVRANVSTPTDADGNRIIVIDLQGVQVPKVDNKEDLLEAIKNALPDVSQITMSEFNGQDPMVRVAIKTSQSDVQASLLPVTGNELILQLTNSRGGNQKTVTRVVDSAAYIGTRDMAVMTPSITPKKAIDPYVSEDRYEADHYKAPATSFREFQHRTNSFPHQFPQVSASSIDNGINIDLPPGHTTDKYRLDALARPADPETPQIGVRGRVVDNSFSQPVLKPASDSRVYAQVVDATPSVAPSNATLANTAQMNQLLAEKQRLESQLAAMQQTQSRLSNLESSLQQLQQENGQLKQQLSVAQAPNTSLLTASDSAGHLVGSVRDLSQANMSTLVAAENAFRQGVQAERAGKIEQAVSSYAKAAQAAPQVPEYAASLGRLYIDQRKLGPARQALETGLAANPGNTEILNELGKISLLEGRTEEASGYFRKALPSGVMSNYASSLMKLERFPDAEQAYKVAIASNPNDADLYYNLGNLYLAQQQYTNALQLYQSALKVQNNLPEAYYQMGIAYAQMGQSANAVNALKNYLNLAPGAANRQSVEQFITQLQRG
jgi:tetratricopeptide (TPR) repeat protein